MSKLVVINSSSCVEIVCKVCGFVARDTKDLESIEKDGGCAECVLHFKYLDVDKWNSGLYPDRKEVREKIVLKLGDL